MDLTWVAQNVVAPIVLSIVGITVSTFLPLLGMKLKKKLQLEIDEKEQAKVDGIVADTVHLVESTVRGGGKVKLEESMKEVASKVADASIKIASKTIEGKIERALSNEGIRHTPSGSKPSAEEEAACRDLLAKKP